MTALTTSLLSMLVLVSESIGPSDECQRPAEERAREEIASNPHDERDEGHSEASPALGSGPGALRLRAPGVPSPQLLQARTPRAPSPGLLDSFVLPCRLDRVTLGLPTHATVVWPQANPTAIPRMHTEVGVSGRAVVLGVIEVVARSGASVGADATPGDEGRNLVLMPTNRFGLQARPSERIELGIEVTRRGPMSFDPIGDEARGMARVLWRFGR